MAIELLQKMLAWSLVINYSLLLLWFVFFIFMHDFVYKIHSKWFKISKETFDAMHYGGIGLFKLLVFVFNLVPYLALWIIK